MTIPFSSQRPDAVQKLLGLSGGAGTFEEAAIGMVVTVLCVWGILRGLKWIAKAKP